MGSQPYFYMLGLMSSCVILVSPARAASMPCCKGLFAINHRYPQVFPFWQALHALAIFIENTEG